MVVPVHTPLTVYHSGNANEVDTLPVQRALPHRSRSWTACLWPMVHLWLAFLCWSLSFSRFHHSPKVTSLHPGPGASASGLWWAAVILLQMPLGHQHVPVSPSPALIPVIRPQGTTLCPPHAPVGSLCILSTLFLTSDSRGVRRFIQTSPPHSSDPGALLPPPFLGSDFHPLCPGCGGASMGPRFPFSLAPCFRWRDGSKVQIQPHHFPA